MQNKPLAPLSMRQISWRQEDKTNYVQQITWICFELNFHWQLTFFFGQITFPWKVTMEAYFECFHLVPGDRTRMGIIRIGSSDE